MKTKTKHPKILLLLASVKMWKCFSYFGVRALLVLYMIERLRFADSYAFGIYAVYCGLAELGGIFGGFVADRILGQRRTFALGGWLLAAGYACLALKMYFFSGLALLVVGSNLFSANIYALLGQSYKENDSKKEEGFTIFYMSVNAGALLGALLCVFFARRFGYHFGFGLAAGGMLIGNILLLFFKPFTERDDPFRQKRKHASNSMLFFVLGIAVLSVIIGLRNERNLLPLLPYLGVACIGYLIIKLLKEKIVSSRKIITLLLFLTAQIVFFAAIEQFGASLVVFTQRFSSKHFLGFSIPPAAILSLNPLIIISMGALTGRLFRQSNIPLRLILPLGIASLTFCGLSIACFFTDKNAAFPVGGIFTAIALISFAELMIGPAIYNFFSEISAKSRKTAIMGLAPLGLALAHMLNGFFSKFMAVNTNNAARAFSVYGAGFAVIAAVLGIAVLILTGGFFLLYRRKTYSW